MSQIPKFGGGKPVIKSTSTVTTRTPAGGSRTITNTTMRELLPCSAASESASRSGCGTSCPSQGGQSRRPPTGTSGIRTPFGVSGIRPPSAGSGVRPPLGSSGIRPPSSGLRPPSSEIQRPQTTIGSFRRAPPSGVRSTSMQRSAMGRSVGPRAPTSFAGQGFAGRKPCPAKYGTSRLQSSNMAASFGGPEIPQEAEDVDEINEREKAIRRKINARGLENRYPQLLSDIVRDTKLEFKKITHYAGLNLKYKEKSHEVFTVTSYKFLGKTEHYDKFLCTRKQFAIRWILHYPVMKSFLDTCQSELPYVLFKLGIHQVLDTDALGLVFKEKILLSSCVIQDFHKKLGVILDKNSDTIVKKCPLKFLPACTMLMSKYVSRTIAHTMENIVNFTNSWTIPPFLKLYVDFDGSLVLSPTPEEVIMMFHSLLVDLIAIGEDLRVMERGRVRGYELKKISLCLTEEFVRQCKTTITNNIRGLYGPILNYLKNLEGRFEGIYGDVICKTAGRASDVLFEEGCEKIAFYKSYIHQVAYIPDNEYFKMGQVDLAMYRTKLHKGLHDNVCSIFRNLSAQHLWEINDICDTFQLIKTRALQHPLTTEELIEIGKFMAWVRNEQLENLNDRLYAALMSLSNLITMGILDSEHIKRNCEAINWLENITPVIDQHSAIYEQLKFEAEDKLQRVIEDINVLITDTYPLLVILDEMDDIKSAKMYLNKITLHIAKIKEVQSQIEWVNKEEVCLNFPKSTYPEFDNLKDYVYPFYHLLKLSLDVQKHVSVWQYGQFDLLDYENANREVTSFCEELEEIKKSYRKKLRQAQDENLPIRFKGTVDDPDILNWPAPLKLCGLTLSVLEEFKPCLVIMKVMCNKALRSRHWKAMSEIAGFNLMPNAGTTLKKMFNYNLKDKLSEYEIISVCATKEEKLLSHLNFLIHHWDQVSFSILHRDTSEMSVLGNLELIHSTAEDHLGELSKMCSSVFVKPFEEDVRSFQSKLKKIRELVDNLDTFQEVFLTLNTIFADIGEISIKLPRESAIFKNECKMVFHNQIELVKTHPAVSQLIDKTIFLENLTKSLTSLEEVQKGLQGYLETIRLSCPRLFLISDKELIALLSSYLTAHINSTPLSKLFPGIYHLKLNAEGTEIVAVLSSHQEELILRNQHQLKLSLNVQTLFKELEASVTKTIKHKHSECFKIFKKTPLKDLVQKYPQQSLQVMAQVFWTDQVESGLKLPHNIKLLMLKRRLDTDIEDKISCIRVGEFNRLHNKIFKNLLIVDLNLRYLLQSFVKDGLVIDDKHFDWQRQLRFYCQNGLCSVKFLESYSMEYGYEYLGNNGQIMMTAQTERCYVTLMIAYFNNYFGLLRGVSQTGKSAIAKCLAESLGKAYYTFNCISKVWASSLNKILKGVSLVNAWASLENANRLRPEVLSSISQKLLECSTSRSFIICHFPIENDSINSKLPENFKALFRTFTLSKPDIETILEGRFASQGIQEFKKCARRLCVCYELLKDLIGTRRHYNFKLNELTKVVRDFKKLRRLHENDYQALCVCIRLAFSCRLIDQDKALFESCLADVFGKNVVPVGDLIPSSTDSKIKEMSLTTNLLDKTREVFACLNTTKSSLVLLGESGTGKTTAMKLCSQLVTEAKLHVFNLDCMDYDTFVGHTSSNPNVQWFDGILLKMIKTQTEGDVRHWILFDGTMDARWTKDILEVIDQGKLALETLEEVTVVKRVVLIFECTELSTCSPAMISRCTTVYFAPRTVSYISLIDRWMHTCNSQWLVSHRVHIEALIKWFLPPCFEVLRSMDLPSYLRFSDKILVSNILTYFQLIMDEADSQNTGSKKEEDLKNLPSWIHATLIQAGILGISSFMSLDSRRKFDEYYKQLWRGQNNAHPYPSCLERLEVGIPTEGVLIDYWYLYKQRGAWKLWADTLKNEKMVESEYLASVIIPTVDTMRTNFLLHLHIKFGKKLVICGPRNTGKTLAMKNCYLNKLPENSFDKSFITCGKHLTPNLLDKLLPGKRHNSDRKYVCFMDDLSCSSNNLDTLELLRMRMDHNVINNETNFIVSTEDCNLSRRLLKNFNVLGISQFTNEAFTKIYSQSLLHSWKKSGLPGDMLNAVDTIMAASLKIYLQMESCLKPTLGKCHYIFDIKALGRVVKGCTLLRKETYDLDKKIYIKLWIHELLRVLFDWLHVEDFKSSLTFIKQVLVDSFSEDSLEIFGSNTDEWPLEKLYFGGFLAKNYEEVSLQHFKDVCEQFLHDYRKELPPKLNLLFFDYALEKLAIICRLLSMPNETSVLLGVTGRGRQSLTKFASFLCKQRYFQPALSSQCSTLADFKLILIQCGSMSQKSVFFVSEEQATTEFLDVADQLLHEGDVTDIYDTEGKQEILERTRLAAQGGNQNLDISTHKVFLYFNKLCRQNLHLVLSLNNFRRRVYRYHSLVTKCNVIYWDTWPDEGLQSIAKHHIQKTHTEEATKDQVATAFSDIFKNSETTPTAYNHFNSLFVDLMAKKQLYLKQKKARFQQGLAKLSYAASQIIDMQKALAEYQPQLEEMTKSAIKMTEQIALETAEVEKASALVREDEKTAGTQAAVAQVLKSECESELAQAIPILEDAITALNTLKPSDITLVKSMKNPPDAVKLVMASVCVIKEVKPDKIPDASTGRKTYDYWGPSKRILGDMNFLQSLKDFDKDHIKPEVISKIRKDYLPHKDFKPNIVAKASSAAEGLCKWIIAMDMYDKVAKEVAPKKVKLDKAEREYAETMRVLNEKKEEVVRIEEKLAHLKALLDDATKKQVNLQKEVDLCNRKLGSAQKLIGGLSGERQRWTEATEKLQRHYDALAGDAILACALVAYLGPLGQAKRTEKLELWRKYIEELAIPLTAREEFLLVSVLSNAAQVEKWLESGLPPTEFFIENALIMHNSQLHCLLLDPHMEAQKWVLNSETTVLTKLTYDDWLSELKRCVSQGHRMFIVDPNGTIPLYLIDFLRGITDGKKIVTIDLEEVQLHSQCKIYLSACKPNANYPAELCTQVTMINFELTTKALEEELLRTVMEIERPEIRKMSRELAEMNRKNKAELKELELKILETLCESQADILEDEASISILDHSKQLSQTIKLKQAKAKETSEFINELKQNFVEVARYVAAHFFCIDSLSRIHHTYQFSLKWFKNIYFMSILNAAKSKHIPTRWRNICQTFSYDLFKSISRGMFEDHKLIFAFWLSLTVAVHKGAVTEGEASVFFQKNVINGECNMKPQWMSNENWLKAHWLENKAGVTGILKSLGSNPDQWRGFFESSNKAPLSVSPFQDLLLTKTFTPHLIRWKISEFVSQTLGRQFLNPMFFDIQQTYNESHSLLPILFILTPGLNVLQLIQNFASVKQVLHKFRHFSLDGNNSSEAAVLIDQGRMDGSWVLLQNCHYAGDWLVTLERMLEVLDFANTHENFRLFLSADPNHEIPLEIIQNSLKIVWEPQRSLKHNLLDVYYRSPVCADDYYYGCPGQQEVFSKRLFSLCNFHFILLRRQQKFENADLELAQQLLRHFINQDSCCLYEKLYYVIGECIYGANLERFEDKCFIAEFLKSCLVNERGTPLKKDRQDYLKYIRSLPDEDPAEVLYLTEQQVVEENLQDMQEFLELGGKLTSTTPGSLLITNILPIAEDLLKLFPENVRTQASGYVAKELGLYEQLLHIIRGHLQDLQSSLLRGNILSEDLEVLANDLLQNKLPKSWLKWCYPTLQCLATFTRSFNENIETLENYDHREVLVRAWYFPKVALAALKLDFARRAELSVEDVNLVYAVEEQSEEDCIVFKGLYVIGARYDTVSKRIMEPWPKTSFTPLPSLVIKPLEVSNDDKNKLTLSVFKTRMRHSASSEFMAEAQNRVTSVNIDCSRTKRYWIKRGVYVVCEVPQ